MIFMIIPIVLSLTTVTTAFEKDTIATSTGGVEITFIGHASVMMKHNGTTIFVDPFGKLADYAQFPKADLVLVTHEHYDHLDTAAIAKIRSASTQFVATRLCAEQLPDAKVLNNGESATIDGIKIEAVPAYNIVHKRPDGTPFHPKGNGNGYILTIGDKRIYFAGDTELIPEMKSLKNIDVAFLPMNLPYTMTPEMTAEAARSFMPKILYPYHTGDTDTKKIAALLKDTKQIEVRIRPMK